MPRFVTAVLATLLIFPVVNAQSDKDANKTTLETAEEVLAANIEATGGAAAWEAITSLQTTGIRISDGPMGAGKMTSGVVETRSYPGFMHSSADMETPMGSMNVVQVRTPDAAWVEAGPIGRREMPVEPAIDIEGACAECTILASDDFVLTDMAVEPFDGRETYVVTLEAHGESLRRFYDAETMLLVADESPADDGGDPLLTRYSDYREVNGVLLPFQLDETVVMRMISRDASGEETEAFHRGASTTTIEEIVVNLDVDGNLFEAHID